MAGGRRGKDDIPVGRSLLPEGKGGTWTMVETSSVERDSGVSKLAGEASGPRIPASNKLK
jgi:hypothetical protein